MSVAWVGAAISAVGVASGASNAKKAAAAQNRAIDAQAYQGEIALDQWDRYKTTFAPLEDAMVAEAKDYDSPEQYEKAAGEASATVASQFGKARDRLTRTPGLDPSSAGFGASMVGLDLAQAATDATAQNAARDRVKGTAYERKVNAISLGKGLPANAAAGFASAGVGAANNALVANQQYNQNAKSAAGLGELARGAYSAYQKSGGFGLDNFTPNAGGVDIGGGSGFEYTRGDTSGIDF